MSRAPRLTLVLAVAALVALPISLHFEGNEGTAEPFLIVFPLAAFAAVVGAVIAWLYRLRALLVLNVLATTPLLIYWIFLVTYEGD